MLLIGRNAHPIVVHRERNRMDVNALSHHLHGELDERVTVLEVGTVLDRVVHEIDATLPESEVVTHKRGVEVLGVDDVDNQFNAAVRHVLGDIGHLLDELANGPRVLGKLDRRSHKPFTLALGALELCKVQNLVDETKKRLGGRETRLNGEPRQCTVRGFRNSTFRFRLNFWGFFLASL